MRNTITKLRSFLAAAAVSIAATWERVTDNQALDIAELEDELELETEAGAALVELHERGLQAEYDGNRWVVYDTAFYSPWKPRDSLAQALQAYLDEKGEGQ